MNKVIFSLLATVVLALVGVAGDFLIKLAGSGKKFVDWRWLMLGLLVYASTAFGWFFVMKNIRLTTLGVYYSVATVLFLVLVGVFYFQESINTYEIIGIAMAIGSLIILGRFA